jgi:Fungal specific transcription factor domain/Fungal Zn(2)-Cys(6) binuclear cluster domain
MCAFRERLANTANSNRTFLPRSRRSDHTIATSTALNFRPRLALTTKVDAALKAITQCHTPKARLCPMAAAGNGRDPRRSRLVAIAPAPSAGSNGRDTPQPAMSHTCQTCARRKVKCDKATPTCSSCRRAKLACTYQPPPPRWRKRKPSEDELHERLARYERVLHQHGLLAETPPSVAEEPLDGPISHQWNHPEGSRTGRLLAGNGKSKYIDSRFWRSFGEHEMEDVLEDEEDQAVGWDPLTGAFLGYQQDLLQYHPTHATAVLLWRTHIENVEPLCKILHIPSTAVMLDRASQDPANVSRTDECLLFAIYHFAVFSMTEDECMEQLGNPRAILLQRYHFATRQALANASFLKTTEMSVLQALVLFLLPCRFSYDSHTYWILTGVAVRIAQRMGLHRDGETLGLPPFEVQMRRRLFYQLLPLDGTASIMSGTGVPIVSDAWDTQQPLNINDDQIWPGMTSPPKEQSGATELIFCLSRACIAKYLIKTDKSGKSGNDEAIAQAEREVEDKYIRYCDVVNPLHFLAICSVRSGITAMRLFARLPKFRNGTATDHETRDMLLLALKLLDNDAAARDNAGLRRYRWHVRPFFLWGTWDSLVFVLTSLWRSDVLAPAEIDAAWAKVEQVYANHDELLASKRALYVALGRLALKAWDTRPASSRMEPAFVAALRSVQRANAQSRENRQNSNTGEATADTLSTVGLPAGDGLGFSDDLGFDLGDDFNLDGTDWTFWDQLMQKP